MAVLLGAGPALASGSFAWDASFKCCLDSRKWYQHAGTTYITSYMNCKGDPVIDRYAITVYRDETIDDNYGTHNYSGGTTVKVSWSLPKSGTYYFHISKANDGKTIYGSGTVSYP